MIPDETDLYVVYCIMMDGDGHACDVETEATVRDFPYLHCSESSWLLPQYR